MLLLAFGLPVLGGCGGSEKPADEATTSAPSETAPLTVAGVAPELAAFGDLAAIEAPPITVSLGSEGGQLDLADTATVTVPAGAFSEDTSLTVTIVGLALNYFDYRLGPARTYAIETDRDYSALEEPVILEIPFPTELSAVAMLKDGEWVEVEVPSGDTTRVELSHFSTTLITFIPASIEYIVEKGWAISKWTNMGIPGAFSAGVKEQVHQGWVLTEADQSTRDFYGLDENGQYRHPTHTQQEMCTELQTVIAGYADFSLPDDYDGYRLGRYLADAMDPAQQKKDQWPEFWDYTKDSMTAINRQVLNSSTPLTPAQVLKIAIDANGGNVPMGLLAAHNYLKNLAYLGREYADPGKLDDNWMPVATKPVPPLTGQPVAHLEPWRQADPANPSGRLDKMGPIYHIFAAAVAGAWGYESVNSGAVVAAGEALLRAGFGIFAGDVPDRQKGLADECGARLGSAVLARASGEEVPAVAEQTPPPAEDLDGIKDGLYLGEVYPIVEPIEAAWWVFEFPQSTVELEVTDDGIAATVEFVQRWSWSGPPQVCIITLRKVYSGQGAVTNPLSLVLEAVEQELVALEGGCSADVRDQSAEEFVLESFAGSQTVGLQGTFSDGLFDGIVWTRAHGVRAAIGE